MAVCKMQPADELVFIRNDIRRLKQREAQLCAGILTGALPLAGIDAVVEIAALHKRVFLRDKLPGHILENEDYWRTDVTRHVRLSPAPRASGRVFR